MPTLDEARFCEAQLEIKLTEEAARWTDERNRRALMARSLADCLRDKDLPGGPMKEAMEAKK